MSKDNRVVANLAREIQESEGLKYTEALRKAQKQTHIDVLPNGGNGSILPEKAETWLPVLTQLKPFGEHQWRILNFGPGFNMFGLSNEYVDEFQAFSVNVTGPEYSSDCNVNSAMDEFLPKPGVPFNIYDSLQDAWAIHVVQNPNPEDESWDGEFIAASIDLRGMSVEKRISTIVSTLNNLVDSLKK